MRNAGGWNRKVTTPYASKAQWTEDRVDDVTKWAHERDGVVEVKKTAPKTRVIPYEEVAARLHARKKPQ